MESVTSDPNSLFTEIEAVSKSSRPPEAKIEESKIKPASRNELIGAAVFVFGPMVVMFLARLIGGASFYVDLLSLGLMCLSFLGLIYAASALGSIFLSKRKKPKPVSWVAAGVLDRVMRADGDMPTEHAVLELLDGRRVTLKLRETVRDVAARGKSGWADIANGELRDFVVK